MNDTPRSPVQHRIITAGRTALAVAEYPAAGPPVLLLHGIGSRGVSWWPVIDGLTPSFHLYVLDLRGHGGSDKPASGYDFIDYAADLAAALDVLDVRRPRIIGHSLGALVSLTWAALHPERAAALVLEDPPLRTLAATLDAIDGWIALAAMTPAAAAAYYQQQYPEWSAEERARRAESITGTASGVFQATRAHAERVLREDGDRLAPLSAQLPPTLLVYGDAGAGGMMTAADVAYFAAAVPRSEAVHIPGAGHNIHRDFPAEFLATAVPFLRAAG